MDPANPNAVGWGLSLWLHAVAAELMGTQAEPTDPEEAAARIRRFEESRVYMDRMERMSRDGLGPMASDDLRREAHAQNVAARIEAAAYLPRKPARRRTHTRKGERAASLMRPAVARSPGAVAKGRPDKGDYFPMWACAIAGALGVHPGTVERWAGNGEEAPLLGQLIALHTLAFHPAVVPPPSQELSEFATGRGLTRDILAAVLCASPSSVWRWFDTPPQWFPVTVAALAAGLKPQGIFYVWAR